MYPRVEYKMIEADMQTILDACKPVPMIMLQCGTPPSQQENANRAWAALGKKMGFDSMTVRPSEKGKLFFTAVPSETPEARKEREAREQEAKRQSEIKRLTDEIAERQSKLKELQS